LYAGVGGLSLGAARAGFHIQCAVELDKHAVGAHAINFPSTNHLQSDVARLNGKRLLELSGLSTGTLSGLIGGPPCQGFSEIGHRCAEDPRNNLFVDFFRLVKETRPAFFLAENVPGILDSRNSKVVSASFAQVPKQYRILEPITVKANEYGAPTSRTRVFFYGYDPERVERLDKEDFAPPVVQDVRVKNALELLPAVRASWQSEAQSWRAVGQLGDSEFHTRIADVVPARVGDPDALARYRKHRLVSGFLGTVHQAATIRRFDELGPGETDRVSKCVRLDREGYCPTLRAGTGPDRGSYQAIRPVHPISPRVITPREAARLQGFPDWFQFHPTKWHAFRQIGNSVSPIVAEALLGRIRVAM